MELGVLAGQRVVVIFILAFRVQCVVRVYLELSILRGGRVLGASGNMSDLVSFLEKHIKVETAGVCVCVWRW